MNHIERKGRNAIILAVVILAVTWVLDMVGMVKVSETAGNCYASDESCSVLDESSQVVNKPTDFATHETLETFYHNKGTPSPNTGTDGDLYYDEITSDYYIKINGSWAHQGRMDTEVGR